VLPRILSGAALADMRILTAWKEAKCDLIYVTLQLAWWLAESSSVLGGVYAAFRGSARVARRTAVRPRRVRTSFDSPAAA
jgi:hypothetical protein